LTARIDVTEETGSASVRVAGRLDESSAHVLLELCHDRMGALLIGLEDLVSADRAAIETLQDLRAAGARLVGASPYMAMLLNGRPDALAAGADHEIKKEKE
jgi:hypothetical protein